MVIEVDGEPVATGQTIEIFMTLADLTKVSRQLKTAGTEAVGEGRGWVFIRLCRDKGGVDMVTGTVEEVHDCT